MHDPAILFIALLIVFVGAIALYRLPGPCVCEHCGFHVDQRRREAAHQAALSHDVQHKGFGYTHGAPDRQDCQDATCKRNRQPPNDNMV